MIFAYSPQILAVIVVGLTTQNLGYDLAGETSVKVLIPSRICPDGYSLVGDRCEKVKLCEAVLECSSGWQLYGGRCVKKDYSRSETVCPEGYHLVGKTKCLRVDECGVDKECLFGTYDREQGVCRSEQISDVELQCETGYTLSPDRFCFREEKRKGELSCPPGSVPGAKGCIEKKEVDPLLRCPLEYDLVGGECIRRFESKPVAICGSGYTLVKDPIYENQYDCVKTVVETGEEFCKNGKLEGNKCVWEKSEPVSVTCGKGFHLGEGGKCLKVIEGEPKLTCSLGYIYDKVKGCCVKYEKELPAVRCTDKKLAKGGKCETIVFDQPQFKCKEGYYLNKSSQMCIKQKVRTPTKSCPSGSSPQNNTCQIITTHDQTRICNKGQTPDGLWCKYFHTLPPTPVCPPSSRLTQDKLNCINTQITPPNEICPPNYTKENDICVFSRQMKVENTCIVGTVSSTKPKTCVTTLTEMPQLSCPPGFTINHDGECFQLDTCPALRVCPECYVLAEGLCIPAQKELENIPHA